MGAQSAALLASGAPLGDPRPPFAAAATVRLAGPDGYDLDAVARSHGGVGLAPTAYDGTVLTTCLPGGALARVHPDLRVELSAPADVTPLRVVLDLDTDLTGLWEAAPQWHGAGRQLRAASPFEALAQALAATNTSYRGTQAMLRELVGDGPFPGPEQVADLPLRRWGYRAASLRELAARVDDVDWEGLDDAALLAAVRALPGFGPFAAASALPLLGRPRPLVLDSWLARQVGDPGPYRRYGRWAGEVVWLEVSRSWLTRAPAGSPAAP